MSCFCSHWFNIPALFQTYFSIRYKSKSMNKIEFFCEIAIKFTCQNNLSLSVINNHFFKPITIFNFQLQSIIYFSENYRTYWSFTLVIFKPCNFVDITMYTSTMDTSTEVLFYKNYRLKKFLEKNMQNGSIARFSDWLYTFWSKSVFIKKMKQMFLLLLVVSVA